MRNLKYVVGLNWASLPENSLVVDVGGGVGSQAMLVARANPKLKVVIQDREGTIAQAREVRLLNFKLNVLQLRMMQYWNNKFPDAVHNGQVSFQGSLSVRYRFAIATSYTP